MKTLQGDWLTVAKSIAQGTNTRIQCCAKDNSRIVSHNERGYSSYCFRCHEPTFEPYGIRTIAEIEMHREQRNKLYTMPVHLPDDYTMDIPPSKMVWFLKYGISAELARRYKIGYSPSHSRIVIPIWDELGLTLDALQLRSTDEWQKPKYINPKGPKVSAAIFRSSHDKVHSTVVVEDVLSAIKVGMVHNATSILGTNMTDARALKIQKAGVKKVYLWLDGDKAGKDGSLDAEKQLRMLGLHVERIRTEHDPKTYPLEEIRNILKND